MSRFNDHEGQEYQEILSHLRSKGIRITETRKGILQYMMPRNILVLKKSTKTCALTIPILV